MNTSKVTALFNVKDRISPMLRFLVGASSLLVGALCSTTPSQVHIAVAGASSDGSPNGMAVSWQTEENTGASVVKFGTSSQQYTSTASGYSSAYYQTYHHHVVLSPLSPNTKYYYVVGDNSEIWSQEFEFISAPASSFDEQSLNFAVFADLGEKCPSTLCCTSFHHSLIHRIRCR